jgi:hypothetical protein
MTFCPLCGLPIERDQTVFYEVGEPEKYHAKCWHRQRETTMQAPIDQPHQRQVGGDHYIQHGRMQPWEIWKHYKLNPWEASAIKYILRRKDPAKRSEDLRKAAHCLEYLAQMVEAGEV